MATQIDTRRLNQILRNVDGDMADVVRKIGFAVEAKAKPKTRVDTGALRNSIYTRTSKENSLPTVAGNPERIALPKPEDDLTVTVGPSVLYGIYNELGTGRMTAQPFLGPAVREVTQALSQFYNDIGEACGDG